MVIIPLGERLTIGREDSRVKWYTIEHEFPEVIKKACRKEWKGNKDDNRDWRCPKTML